MIKFLGYFSYPNEDWGHAVFEVKAHNFLPDGRYAIDSLRRFKIKIDHPFPTRFEWTRERYERRRNNHKFLKNLCEKQPG